VFLTLKVRGTDIDGTKLCSLARDLAPLTGKIIKNCLRVFERGENLLQNGMFYFVFWISQLSEIRKARIYVNEKPTFLKSAPQDRVSFPKFIKTSNYNI